MKDYGYYIDLPHPAVKVWAIMQDYDKWTDFADTVVTGVEVQEKGDENGNGLKRCVNYKLPLGFRGTSYETISDCVPGVGYTYTSKKGTVGKVRLEKLEDNTTRLHFQEHMQLNPPFSWFENTLRKFMQKNNRKTMKSMGQWLTEHPDY